MIRHDFEWKEIKVFCEYIKNLCFDYVAKFPLQKLKTMRSLHGNETIFDCLFMRWFKVMYIKTVNIH